MSLITQHAIFRSTGHGHGTRLVVACISLLGCFLGIWTAGRAGFSRLRSDQAMQKNMPALADDAIRLSTSDPQSHYARALVLSRLGQLADAVSEFETAAALRPGDYALWLELGSARERIDDHEGALAAFKEAVRLAPGYARPRWEIGQLLLDEDRRDEAFAELRRAVVSRPALFLEVVKLAWKTYGGDATAVEAAVQPQTGSDRLVLARFIFEHGNLDEAMKLFRAAGEIPDDGRRSFLTELLAGRRFKEAHEVWLSRRKGSDRDRLGSIDAITDGSLESQIVTDDPGFGWQLGPAGPGTSVSLDDKQPHDGNYSLFLRFAGNPSSSTRIITQLVLVSPRTHYRLSFAARTEQLSTGGPPVVVVTDASKTDGQSLAQSLPLPSGTNEWREYTLEFTTTDATEGIIIAIQRQNCTSEQCPIFGRVWFDSFSLQNRF
jgi:tetratricopeptide (TPR) repeat protein